MNSDEKAHQFASQLQAVIEGTESAVAQNASVREALSSQEIRVLRTVGGHERCIMSAIAARIRLSLSSATGLIDRLVDKKLVCRDRSQEDRRVVQVELTDKGRGLHASVMDSQVQFVRGLLKTLSAEEQDTLLALFGKISDRIKAEKESA